MSKTLLKFSENSWEIRPEELTFGHVVRFLLRSLLLMNFFRCVFNDFASNLRINFKEKRSNFHTKNEELATHVWNRPVALTKHWGIKNVGKNEMPKKYKVLR